MDFIEASDKYHTVVTKRRQLWRIIKEELVARQVLFLFAKKIFLNKILITNEQDLFG